MNVDVDRCDVLWTAHESLEVSFNDLHAKSNCSNLRSGPLYFATSARGFGTMASVMLSFYLSCSALQKPCNDASQILQTAIHRSTECGFWQRVLLFFKLFLLFYAFGNANSGKLKSR